MQMAAITGLCSKIINVICFNYMVICGEIYQGIESEPIATGFAYFYGAMIKTPFFGSYYTTIAPLCILLLAITFGLMGVFKYNSKTVEGL
mmetsp:Transcript_31702/g.48556  ORF Transcript_31702/g.48556 Transcript_31702/m.48556 type:complete len:90 (+) Transcript_31702:1554-1823(+)